MIKKTSIRNKILIFLTALPIATLAAYLLIAIGVFKDDKLAYVFDSSSALSRGIASQTKAQFINLSNMTKPIFQEYAAQTFFGPVADGLFLTEPTLLAVQVYSRVGTTSWKMQAIKERTVGSLQNINRRSEFNQWLSETIEQKRIVRSPGRDDKFLLFERVKAPQGEQYFVMVSYFLMPELKAVFTSSSSSSLYLINSKGEVLMGPEKAIYNDFKVSFGSQFLNLLTNDKTADGVKVMNVKGREWITSFGKTGFSDLFVVGLVDKDKAFGAVSVLVKKSLLFFGLLISITLLLSVLATTQLTESITELFLATKRVAQGEFDVKVKVQSSDEVGSLAESFNVMASEISRLMSETAEKVRMESELKTARMVQETLFPKSSANLPGLKIFGHYEPASECGGDWWYHCQIGEKYFLWIGDATGHGASAALLTSAARSASTIIERLNISPAKAMELLNRAIYDVSKGNLMMTFVIASYDPVSRRLEYCNASHEPPFLIKKQEFVPKKVDLIPLNEVNNSRLGQFRDSKYDQASIELSEGDVVFFYTDGITGIRDPKGKELGERKLLKSLMQAVTDFPTPEIISQRLLGKWGEHRSSGTLSDDVTFFVIQTEGIQSENI